MIRCPRISRRTVLRGMGGVALGLPGLEIMHTARAGGVPPPPVRLLVWTTPNGTVMERWRPVAGVDERDFALSEILEPLAPYQDEMVVIQHLRQWGGHAHHCIASLTARPIVDNGFPNISSTGISLDQYLAQAPSVGQQTPHASLQLGVEIKQNLETASCVSWRGAGEPVPAENNPYRVFSTLFVPGDDSGAEVRELLAEKRSIIDGVMEQTSALSMRMGTADRAVLENYLDSLRDLEQRLIDLEESQAACVTPDVPADPSASPDDPFWMREENVPAVIDVYRRLIVAAFSCDMTRVITINLSNDGGAYRQHSWIDGIDHGPDWHGHSHNVELGIEDGLVAIERWYYGQLAELVGSLKSAVDIDGEPLLRNCLILNNDEYGPNGPVSYLPVNAGTGQRDNLSHFSVLMPYMLIGQAGGALETGRNLVYAFENEEQAARGQGPSHTHLLVSILQLMGLPDESFGDPEAPQGPLPGLV